MKYFLFLLLCCSSTIFAQENCMFKSHNKTGGNYYFSTFYQDNMQTPLDGTCESRFNGTLYERRIFEKGKLIEEQLNFTNFKPRVRYNRLSKIKDSTIATLVVYYENGKIEYSSKYYIDKSGRRCEFRQEYWANGYPRFSYYMAFIRRSEIDQYNDKNYPPHTVDEEGYTYLTARFGDYMSYDDAGNLKEKVNYKAVFQSNFFVHEIRQGKFTEYHSNGKVFKQGYFNGDDPDGDWLVYDFNGKLYEELHYRRNMKVDVWKGYYPSGALRYQRTYDTLSEHLFKPNKLEWAENGIKTLEVFMDQKGNGFQKVWNAKGVLIEEFDILAQRDYGSFHKKWFEDGKVQSIKFNQAENDTSYVEYFSNGKMARLNMSVEAVNPAGKRTTVSSKVWNFNGVLMSDVSSTSGQDFNEYSGKMFHENGELKSFIFSKNKERFEENYASNGIKVKSLQRLDGLLNGDYQTFDSLGNILIRYNYSKGLRDGICSEYDSKGNLVFQQKYENGCVDKFYEEAKIENLDWNGLVNKEQYRQITYAYLNRYGNKYFQKLNNQQIDSIAQAIFYFKKNWKSGLDFPFEANSKFEKSIDFKLQKNLFQGADICDTTNKYVKDLFLLFQKLGWQYPSKMKLDGNFYTFTFFDDHFYTNYFFELNFNWYVLNGFVIVPEQKKEVNKLGLETFNKLNRPSHFSIYKFNDCCYRADYSNRAGSFNWIIYNDGTVEFYNQSANWDKLAEIDEMHYRMFED